ncbi:MAG: IS110 family transposase [Bacteroidota bacterium]
MQKTVDERSGLHPATQACLIEESYEENFGCREGKKVESRGTEGKYDYFIGIDISKEKLDYAVFYHDQFLFHRQTKNQVQEIVGFMADLGKLKGFALNRSVFCMEDTGFYGNRLLNVLANTPALISVEHAPRIKKSSGLVRGKDDKSDAIRIAEFAYKNRKDLREWVPRRPVMLVLKNLSTVRSRLVNVTKMLKTSIQEQKGFVDKNISYQSHEICIRSLNAIKTDLRQIDVKIKRLLKSDKRLARLDLLINSVPGMGPVTTTEMIIWTNEFINFTDPKKFACYVGVAPFKQESGKKIAPAKVSKMADRRLKSLLYFSAMTVATHDEEFRSYMKRRTEIDGKHKMAVYNAIKNKLILRIFACVKHDRLYQKSYNYANVSETTVSGVDV